MLKTRNRTWYLYRITCCVLGVGDYFGITTRPEAREREHRRGKNRAKIKAAIALHGQENFSYEIVDSFAYELDARIAEFDHIRRFKTGWPNGLNVLSAGCGVYDELSYRETYKRRCEAQRKAVTEKRRLISSETVKRWLSDPVKAEWRRAKMIAITNTPERKAMAREWGKKAVRTEEGSRTAAEKVRQMWKEDDTFRARMMEVRKRQKKSAEYVERDAARAAVLMNDPSTRAKQKESVKRAWQGEKGEKRKQKLRERWTDPEYRAKCLTAMLSARPKNISPEMRASMSVGQRRRWEKSRALDKPEGNA